LTWGKGKFNKTVPLDRDRNVVVMTTKPGISKYTAFAASVQSLEPVVCCFVATGAPQSTAAEVTDDEGSDAGSDASTMTEDAASELYAGERAP
jgi:hypothetical protein